MGFLEAFEHFIKSSYYVIIKPGKQACQKYFRVDENHSPEGHIFWSFLIPKTGPATSKLRFS